MSEGLPDGWSLVKISDFGKVVTGSTPDTKNDKYWNGNIPFISPADFTNSVYVKQTERNLTSLGSEKGRLLPKNSILVTCIGSLGGIAINPVEATTNQQINAVIPNDENNFRYCFYAILQNIKELDRFAGTTTLPIINKSIFEEVKLLRSPLPEQKKIAKILSSVDEVIETTETQINKLKDLKKGLINELLSKGIGHTEFKDSPVGRIPVGWEVVLLDSISKRGSGHTPDKKKPKYWHGGIKWVSLSDSFRLDNIYISKTDKEISMLGIKNSSAVIHTKDTVIISRDAGVGKSAILKEDMAVSQHFIAWECGDKLNNVFFYYLLQLWKPKFEAVAIGSTIKTIGLPYFKKIQIPLPPLFEQQKIASILSSIDTNIEQKQTKLTQSRNLKKSLMADLLMGRVRVKLDKEQQESL